MECEQIVFTGHAVRRMFERAVGRADVLEVLRSGEVIAEYPKDKPFPSRLILGSVGGRALHVVVAVDSSRRACHIVTVYDPDRDLWDSDLRSRRRS